MTAADCCKDCKFFQGPFPGTVPGLCRRYPPRRTESVPGGIGRHADDATLYEEPAKDWRYQRSIFSEFTAVHQDDWCGEFDATKDKTP